MISDCDKNSHTFGLPSPSPPVPKVATPFRGGDFPTDNDGSTTKMSSSFLTSGNPLEIAAV